MDTSGDKPPQYDNSLIVLSFTQKAEPRAKRQATKQAQKAASKPSQRKKPAKPKAQPATHKKTPKTTYCLSCNKVFSIVSLVVMVLELA